MFDSWSAVHPQLRTGGERALRALTYSWPLVTELHHSTFKHANSPAGGVYGYLLASFYFFGEVVTGCHIMSQVLDFQAVL